MRPRTHALFVIWLVVALVAAGCGGSGDDETVSSPTAGSSPTTEAAREELACGAEITDSVTLAADMRCDPVALIITGDDVTLDLDGHTISGPGAGRRAWPLPNFDVAGIIVRGRNATVRNGTIRETGIGVLVNGAANDGAGATGTVVTDIVTTANYYGIYLFQTSGSRIDGNTVRANVYGLHLQQSTQNSLTNNDLSAQTHHSPGGYGLYLYSSDNNHVEFNTVADNLNWGLWFSDSTENTIVRNNIIGNDPQVSDDSGGNVFYDAESREGNYWDDYAAEDANGDGIGDLPYSIGGPGRSADIYPFTEADGWANRTGGTLDLTTPPPTPKLPARTYIALANGDIAAVDAEEGTRLGTWEAGVSGDSLAVSPDGTRLYAIGGDAFEATNVIALDTAAGAMVDNWETPGATVLAATYDGERVIASSPDGLYEIVLATGEVRMQHDGANAVSITPSWKHNLVLVTDSAGFVTVVYLPDQHAAYKMDLGGLPIQAIDNRAGTRLFVLLEDSLDVQVIDTEQFLITDRIPLEGIDPGTARIAPSPDGTLLYVLDRTDSRLVAIDLGTKQVVAEVRFSDAAVDLAVSGDGEYVSVATSNGSGGGLTIYNRDLDALDFLKIEAEPVVVVAAR